MNHFPTFAGVTSLFVLAACGVSSAERDSGSAAGAASEATAFPTPDTYTRQRAERSGTLTVTSANETMVSFSVSVLNDANIGATRNVLATWRGDAFVFEGTREECRLELKVASSDTVEIAQTGTCFAGVGVDASGTYKRGITIEPTAGEYAFSNADREGALSVTSANAAEIRFSLAVEVANGDNLGALDDVLATRSADGGYVFADPSIDCRVTLTTPRTDAITVLQHGTCGFGANVANGLYTKRTADEN